MILFTKDILTSIYYRIGIKMDVISILIVMLKTWQFHIKQFSLYFYLYIQMKSLAPEKVSKPILLSSEKKIPLVYILLNFDGIAIDSQLFSSADY